MKMSTKWQTCCFSLNVSNYFFVLQAPGYCYQNNFLVAEYDWYRVPHTVVSCSCKWHDAAVPLAENKAVNQVMILDINIRVLMVLSSEVAVMPSSDLLRSAHDAKITAGVTYFSCIESEAKRSNFADSIFNFIFFNENVIFYLNVSEIYLKGPKW